MLSASLAIKRNGLEAMQQMRFSYNVGIHHFFGVVEDTLISMYSNCVVKVLCMVHQGR